MNSTSIKYGLGLLALVALCGCTDHGPVGLYSQELFNKTIAPPNLAFSSASTPSDVSSGNAGSSLSNPQGITVQLVNNGGSATYGPINVTFTASGDSSFVLVGSNHALDNFTLVAPSGMPTACYGGGNQEIPANGGSPFSLLEGLLSGPNITQTSSCCSFHFYVNSSGSHTVHIDVDVLDALGYHYHSSFTLGPFNS